MARMAWRRASRSLWVAIATAMLVCPLSALGAPPKARSAQAAPAALDPSVLRLDGRTLLLDQEPFLSPGVSGFINPVGEVFRPLWYSGFRELRGPPEPLPSEIETGSTPGKFAEAGRRLALVYGYHYLIWARERAKLLAGQDPLAASVVASMLAAVGSGVIATIGDDLQERLYLNTRLTVEGVRFGLSLAMDMSSGEYSGFVQVDISTIVAQLMGTEGRVSHSVAMRTFWEPGEPLFLTAAPWGTSGDGPVRNTTRAPRAR